MSKTLPYSPMGPRTPPAGEPEVAGMFKKLAARSSPNVSVSNEGQSPQAKDAPKSWPTETKQGTALNQPPRPVGRLIWADREPGSMGRYDISHWYSCCQIGQPPNHTFEVWTREPLTGGMKQLAIGLKTWDEARTLAQRDALEHYARGDR